MPYSTSMFGNGAAFAGGFANSFNPGMGIGAQGFQRSRDRRHDAQQNEIQRAWLQQRYEMEARMKEQELERERMAEEAQAAAMENWIQTALPNNPQAQAAARINPNAIASLMKGSSGTAPAMKRREFRQDELKGIDTQIGQLIKSKEALGDYPDPAQLKVYDDQLEKLYAQRNIAVRDIRYSEYEGEYGSDWRQRFGQAREVAGGTINKFQQDMKKEFLSPFLRKKPAERIESPTTQATEAAPEQVTTQTPASVMRPSQAAAPTTQPTGSAALTQSAFKRISAEARAMAPGASAQQLKQLAAQLMVRYGFDPRLPVLPDPPQYDPKQDWITNGLAVGAGGI